MRSSLGLFRRFHRRLDNSSELLKPIDQRIAEELAVHAQQVAAAIVFGCLCEGTDTLRAVYALAQPSR